MAEVDFDADYGMLNKIVANDYVRTGWICSLPPEPLKRHAARLEFSREFFQLSQNSIITDQWLAAKNPTASARLLLGRDDLLPQCADNVMEGEMPGRERAEAINRN